jgi:cob(I)alamin adenosyltransferase
MAYFTGSGDSGDTGLLSGGRISKNSPIMEAIGNVDELNSSIGIALFYIRDEHLRNELKIIQNKLFSIGAVLASHPDTSSKHGLVKSEDIEWLEKKIDETGSKFPKLSKFVLPRGTEEAVFLHLSRTIARRAERSVVKAKKEADSAEMDIVLKYLNRLSSFLFVAAVYMNMINGVGESSPTY